MTAFIGDALLVGAFYAGWILAATVLSVCALAAWFKVCEVLRGR